MKQAVAVLGASSKPGRYSYKAVEALLEAGHTVFPVHPSGREVNGLRCYPSLCDIEEPLDTITVYVSEKNSEALIGEILDVGPRRVILNPGAESEALRTQCESAGIRVEEACTLVLVTTGQF